jgi:hypothetical protein
MEEFSGLAARVVASVSDLRGCLILDRDGLVLGAYPEGQEVAVKGAWLRFAALGEADKGFVEFGDVLWAYVRRGHYAAFAVSSTNARPGFVIDQLEQILLTAEEIRSKRDALRLPEVAPAPSSRPRTPLHPEPRPAAPSPQPETGRPAPAGSPADSLAVSPAGAASPAGPPASASPARPPVRPSPTSVPPVVPTRVGPPGPGPQGPPGVRPSTAPARPASGPSAAPSPAPGPASGPEAAPPTEPVERDDDSEVDPVLLAQEFSRLLQESGNGDET